VKEEVRTVRRVRRRQERKASLEEYLTTSKGIVLAVSKLLVDSQSGWRRALREGSEPR